MKYTFLDVEFANTKNKSICQMGLITTKDDLTKEREYQTLVNPLDGFDDICKNIHHISEGQVTSAPSFSDVWKIVSPNFTNTVLVGHNVASADIDGVTKNLRRFNEDVPEIYYIDTIDLAKNIVPVSYTGKYNLSEICKALNIELINHHNALQDAYASYTIFKKFVEKYSIAKLQDFTKRYIPHETVPFSEYASASKIRHLLYEFAGKLNGFCLDREIQVEEVTIIEDFYKKLEPIANTKELVEIVNTLKNILADGKITLAEATVLENCITKCLENCISSSEITVATQILEGLLQGIGADSIITTEECKGLQDWLFAHDFLKGHYPFDRIFATVSEVLKDGMVTASESKELISCISGILNPVDSFQENNSSNIDIFGKTVCLSGNFEYGSKADVEKYLLAKGAVVETSVKKTTNILLVGSQECSSWSNGSYGTKVKKALEYNEKFADKGVHIRILKEKDWYDLTLGL